MVGDEHDRARPELGVEAAGGVREHERRATDLRQRLHGRLHPVRTAVFVQMRPALHERDRSLADTPEHEPSGVAGDARFREARQLGVGKNYRLDHVVCKRAWPEPSTTPTWGTSSPARRSRPQPRKPPAYDTARAHLRSHRYAGICSKTSPRAYDGGVSTTHHGHVAHEPEPVQA